jgi:hypothetical protein
MNTSRVGQVMTMALFSSLLTFATPIAAKEQRVVKVCQWRGTAPFCNGSCPKGWTLDGRASTAEAASRVDPASHIYPQFGKSCATGTKARCCRYK